VLKNIGSNWIVTLVTVVALYLLTPFTLRTLGVASYGTWVLMTSITGYLGLLVLGVPMASVRYFAEHVASGDVRKLNQAIGSCTGLYLLLGGVSLIVGLGMYAFFTLYGIPARIHGDARSAFAAIVLVVSFGFVALLPEGILSAYGDFVPRNLVRLASLLLRVGLTVGLLTLRASLTVLALVQLACVAFDFALCWLVIRRRHPDIRIRVADFDWAVVRRILSFSVYVLVLNAGARLSFETDSLVIGGFINVDAIPYFSVANSLIIYLMEFVVAIAAVVMPMATQLHTQGKSAELREVFLKWSKIALSLTMMAGLFLVVLGPRFIGWWIEPGFEKPSGQVLQILMVSYLIFLPVRGVALPVLLGLGKTGVATIGALSAGLLNLGLSIVLARPLGLAGVALGTAIPNALFAVLVLLYTCRELKTPVAEYVRYVVPRAALGALPVLGLLLWFKLGLDVRSLAGLAVAGIAMVVLFGLIWVLFVFRKDPYVELRAPLPLRRVWGRA